jgi:transcriptional regulator with XRE-family HTH domain
MNNLKKRREELNLTQKQVADNAQIGLRLYQYYEQDQKEPSVRTGIKLADALKSTVEKLFKV